MKRFASPTSLSLMTLRCSMKIELPQANRSVYHLSITQLEMKLTSTAFAHQGEIPFEVHM